ncbi:probable RNA-directed DNA polymerase from transposon BS [Trichonephila clavipes]|uniref:Probable RNA-directed DNA polymerase from transposon BS n=1 Tax=Trichonephila clavipes TaxID=2585209 RepID=A0A8X6W1D5_TRICX|nr:probable RNA-directed DNA polymerase from transposon BS [Trichonephila clavipes]
MESGLMLYNERCDTLRTAFDSEIIDPSDLNASTIISSSSLEPTKSPSLPRELTESPLFPRGSTEGPPVNELTEGPPVNELTEGPPVNGLTEGPPVNGTTEGSFLLSGPIKDPSFQNGYKSSAVTQSEETLLPYHVQQTVKHPSEEMFWGTFHSECSGNLVPFRLEVLGCCHISEKQAGFRRSYNTTEQIVRLTQHIKDGFQKKQSTPVVFVDFKSAFDRVWRKMLLKKLLHINVSGHLFKWISDFLSQRFLNIKYGNSRSEYGQTRQGLPQGSVLSPVLLNITINDLLSFIDNAVPEINSLLYADDLVLWSTGSDIPKLESTLNSALVTLASWSLENDFKDRLRYLPRDFYVFQTNLD